MKTERNILIAFLLNLAFAVFEFFGGIYTGSVAILSDAVHDLGDAAGIGISWFMERKSKKPPDSVYTYGYGRFSVLGGFLTTGILIFGSGAMLISAVGRLIEPRVIHYEGMILFGVVGVCVNLCAAFFTREGDSLNQKAVNLHMLEDVFGWALVLIGAIVMHFADIPRLDPLLSIGVSLFILFHALGNLKKVADLFLQKAPTDPRQLETDILQLEGVLDVHHIHLWSLDGYHHCATMHIVTDREPSAIKEALREALHHRGIAHLTLELESPTEHCRERSCTPTPPHPHHHHNH